MEIIPERSAETFVAVGKSFRFTSQGITSPFIPPDQRLSDIYNRHADTVCAAFLGEGFCRVQQSAT